MRLNPTVSISHLITAQVGGQLVDRDVVQELYGGGEGGEVFQDEPVDEGVQTLQTVEQRQFLQVQEVILVQVLLHVLAAEIHRSPNLYRLHQTLYLASQQGVLI